MDNQDFPGFRRLEVGEVIPKGFKMLSKRAGTHLEDPIGSFVAIVPGAKVYVTDAYWYYAPIPAPQVEGSGDLKTCPGRFHLTDDWVTNNHMPCLDCGVDFGDHVDAPAPQPAEAPAALPISGVGMPYEERKVWAKWWEKRESGYVFGANSETIGACRDASMAGWAARAAMVSQAPAEPPKVSREVGSSQGYEDRPNPIPWIPHDTGDSRGTVIKSADGDTVAILMGSVFFTKDEAIRICNVVNSFGPLVKALKRLDGACQDLGRAALPVWEYNAPKYIEKEWGELADALVEAASALSAAGGAAHG